LASSAKAPGIRFSERYRHVGSDVIRRIEGAVFGCDYGATSWTDRNEAEAVAGILSLSPGKRLLEIGCGSGWPGLYLATYSGCEAVLTDLPMEGLRAAADRAEKDGLAGRCWPAMADGAALPFGGGGFDAIYHSDVLCCLEAKAQALRECRRVIAGAGRMVFSALTVAPDLSPGDSDRALSLGPPFLGSETDYPTMLRQTGWEPTNHADQTGKFFDAVRAMLAQEESHAKELTELLGEAAYAERLSSRRKRIEGLELGFIRREQFTVIPASVDGPGE